MSNPNEAMLTQRLTGFMLVALSNSCKRKQNKESQYILAKSGNVSDVSLAYMLATVIAVYVILSMDIFINDKKTYELGN